jgi:hypothetical protein
MRPDVSLRASKTFLTDMLAYQGGNAYLYIASDTSDNGTIAASEIALVGTFTGVAAGGFTAANYAVLVA